MAKPAPDSLFLKVVSRFLATIICGWLGSLYGGRMGDIDSTAMAPHVIVARHGFRVNAHLICSSSSKL
jgi:hypothetical protein